MQKEEQLVLVGALWVLFGVISLIYGDIYFGISSIFLGFLFFVELVLYGPNKFARVEKGKKNRIVIGQFSLVAAGMILGYFFIGGFGATIGFILTLIVSEIIVYLILLDTS